MASDPDFVTYAVDQMAGAGTLSYRKMFGEYAIYCDGKVVALICDNQLFVKPTGPGREFIGEVVQAPPYPGAKPSFLVDEQLDNNDWMRELIRITAGALPAPKSKKKVRQSQ